jgi:hypothetical protein
MQPITYEITKTKQNNITKIKKTLLKEAKKIRREVGGGVTTFRSGFCHLQAIWPHTWPIKIGHVADL